MADQPIYYAVKVGPDRYDLRQVRYRAQYQAGREHPHDVMAAHFGAAELRATCARYFPNAVIDFSALEPNANPEE